MILILLIFLVICFIFLLANDKKNEMGNAEHFQWEPLWVGKTSLDCYNENPRDCMTYSNCGLCHKDEKKKCLPGDVNGPFFEENCPAWEYTNYYDKYVFGEKDTIVTSSWDRFLPGFEQKFPNPIARSTLQSFAEQAR